MFRSLFVLYTTRFFPTEKRRVHQWCEAGKEVVRWLLFRFFFSVWGNNKTAHERRATKVEWRTTHKRRTTGNGERETTHKGRGGRNGRQQRKGNLQKGWRPSGRRGGTTHEGWVLVSLSSSFFFLLWVTLAPSGGFSSVVSLSPFLASLPLSSQGPPNKGKDPRQRRKRDRPQEEAEAEGGELFHFWEVCVFQGGSPGIILQSFWRILKVFLFLQTSPETSQIKLYKLIFRCH